MSCICMHDDLTFGRVQQRRVHVVEVSNTVELHYHAKAPFPPWVEMIFIILPFSGCREPQFCFDSSKTPLGVRLFESLLHIFISIFYLLFKHASQHFCKDTLLNRERAHWKTVGHFLFFFIISHNILYYQSLKLWLSVNPKMAVTQKSGTTRV